MILVFVILLVLRWLIIQNWPTRRGLKSRSSLNRYIYKYNTYRYLWNLKLKLISRHIGVYNLNFYFYVRKYVLLCTEYILPCKECLCTGFCCMYYARPRVVCLVLGAFNSYDATSATRIPLFLSKGFSYIFVFTPLRYLK